MVRVWIVSYFLSRFRYPDKSKVNLGTVKETLFYKKPPKGNIKLNCFLLVLKGNLCEEPSSKMARASVTICDMNFTATGNALVVIDSLGQLYVYRMSPISDPGDLNII